FNMIINSQASACAPAARAGCQSPTPDRSGDGLLATVAIPDAVAVPDAVARARLEGDGTGTNAQRTENFGHGRPEPRNEARRRGCRDDHGQEASLARAKDEVRGPGDDERRVPFAEEGRGSHGCGSGRNAEARKKLLCAAERHHTTDPRTATLSHLMNPCRYC